MLTEGEDVQLDKTIADALLEPMLHLVKKRRRSRNRIAGEA